MIKRTSQLPGFYKLTVGERRKLVAETTGVPVSAMAGSLDGGGLSVEIADKFVENVIGTYGLPYGVTLNVRVNGQDHVAPMVVEEPSVVAAASNAAKMVRSGGGFHVEVDEPIMISQVQLIHVKDRGAAGAVSLTVDTDGHWVTFLVSDNGPGVSPDFAGRLFEPYATTKSSGTGLGLAIAQRIAYEHAGELSYAGPSGTVPGQVGAAFRLVLPIEGPPPQSEMAPTSSEPSG